MNAVKGIDSNKICKKQYLYGILTVVITFLITMSYMHLWGTNIHVPLTGYRSDSIGVLLEANNYVRGGDVHRNVCYGAPELGRYTYAIGDSSVPMPLLKILKRIFGSVEAAVNIQAIMNSLLLAYSMYWVCCSLKLKSAISMIVGISYPCISYFVLFCNTLLLIYGFCFYIPLFCYIVIDIMSLAEKEKNNKIKEAVFTILIMFFVGLNSAYYAFLAMIILAFAGMYTLISIKSVDKVLLVIVSYISIAIGIAVYTMPNILFRINSQLFDLLWNTGWYYGFWLAFGVILALCGFGFYKKIYPHITMKTIWAILCITIVLVGIAYTILRKYTDFLGVYDGRSLYSVELGSFNIVNTVLPAINNIINSVNSELPFLIDLENQDVTSLGILVGVGFCYSVLCVFQFKQKLDRKSEIVRICGLCNCFMTILAVKGGFSALIASYITTGIRNYNRICIFIAVFSLISFGIFLEKLLCLVSSLSNTYLRRVLCGIVCACVLLAMAVSCPTDFISGDSFGLVEYEQRKKEYDDWTSLMNNIERTMPEDSMILELPLTIEGTYFGELMEQGRAYELGIPAVISKTTVWSYAGGWRTDIDIVNNTEQFIQAVYDAGFQGIYLDALLYHDDTYIEQLNVLKQFLGEPIICNEKRRYFFDLSHYMEN